MSSWLHPCTWSVKTEPNTSKPYDFIVCGGGSAGCALASRLSEDSKVRVLLLEAGGHGLVMDARVPLACGKLQNTALDWADFAEPQPGRACTNLKNGTSFWPRGKGLGGSSLINYMAYVRGKPADFDSWAKLSGDARWSGENCLPAFHRIESVLGITVRQPVHGLAKDFLQAVSQLGHSVGNYNGSEQAGLHTASVLKGARCSSADAYLWNNKAAKRANLDIVCHALVDRVVFDDEKRAVAVEFFIGNDKRLRSVRASKEIILSCSAVGTPLVLQRSGVGNEELLTKLGIPVLVPNAEVGENLQDHLALLQLVYEKKGKKMMAVNAQRAEGTPLPLLEWLIKGKGMLASSAYDASLFFTPENSKTEDDMPQGQVSLFVSAGGFDTWEKNIQVPTQGFIPKSMLGDDGEGAILLPTLLHPESRGRVELKSRDARVGPKITANYLEKERDLQVLVDICLKGVAIASKMDLVGGFVVPEDLKQMDPESREFWEIMVRRNATTLYHPASTCRIGSVVTSDLKVKQVTGLRIADASVMPHLTSGNTNAPAIMIGERCAEFIAEEYGLKLDWHATMNKVKL